MTGRSMGGRTVRTWVSLHPKPARRRATEKKIHVNPPVDSAPSRTTGKAGALDIIITLNKRKMGRTTRPGYSGESNGTVRPSLILK